MPDDQVAIVGMAVRAPGANDLRTFWTNVRDGVDAVGPVPTGRIPEEFFAPVVTGGAGEVAALSSRRGGFVDTRVDIDVAALGISPASARAIEPDQLVALTVAEAALRDARVDRTRVDPARIAVILGRGGYLAPAAIRFSNRVRLTRQVAHALREITPDLSKADLDQALRALVEAAADGPGTDVIGLVSNLCASRIANRLDLQGPAYTVDGACASSLLAIDQGVNELLRGRSDVVVAGGVHHCQEPSFWSVFTELRALSRSDTIRPFDRRADGTLVGEATGVVVLKRAADARRDGDRVYALVAATGVSSDGRTTGLVNPNPAAQRRAVEAAWAAAGVDPTAPGALGLIEGHGTATPAGDAAELETVRAVFGDRRSDEDRPVIGTVKSMVGHTMPAAGVLGVIKASLALHHATLPPTLHCEEPHALLAGARARPLDSARPWREPARGARRAGVNAFGFGGINVHVVLTGADVDTDSAPGRAPGRSHLPAALGRGVRRGAGASPHEALAACLDAPVGADPVGTGPFRAAVRDVSQGRRRVLAQQVESGIPVPVADDVLVCGPAVDRGRIAFLFPGTEAALAARPDEGRTGLDGVVRSLFMDGVGWDQRLRAVGIVPDLVAGVSMGEFAALASVGATDADDVLQVLGAVPWTDLDGAGCEYAVVAAPVARVHQSLKDTSVVLTHDNAPTQCIVSGSPDEVDRVLVELLAEGIAGHAVPLPDRFHQAAATPVVEALTSHLPLAAFRPPTTTIWSAATAAPYPDDPMAVRDHALGQLARPVRLRELSLALAGQGVRAMISLGPGSTHALVAQTLAGHESVSVAVGSRDVPFDEQLAWVDAALWTARARADTPDEIAAAGRIRVDLAFASPLLTLDRASGPSRRPAADGSARPVSTVAVAAPPLDPSLWSAVRHEGAGVVCVVPVSTSTMPFLRDHCFFHQRPDWPDESDRWPVVPGTTILHLCQQAAMVGRPGLEVSEVADLRLRDWLVASPPVDVELSVTPDGDGQVRTALGRYATAVVRLAAHLGEAPAAPTGPWPAEGPSEMSIEEIYTTRRLFHGPSFRRIHRIEAMGSRHVRGTLLGTDTPGALLDSAGQLFGCWMITHTDRDNRMLPVGIDSVRFFGALPGPDVPVDALVEVVTFDDESVSADITLSVDGRVVVAITGWTNRRFSNDHRSQAAETWPEYRAVSQMTRHGWVLLRDSWPDLPSRLIVMRNHLGSAERAAFERVAPPQRRAWLLGRIALKDAVRYLLWSRGDKEVFPAEIVVDHEPSGRPVVRGLHGRVLDDVHVTVSHSGPIAVARAQSAHAVGIDVEGVRPLSEAAGRLAFDRAERDLVTELADRFALERDLVSTAFWSAKESVGKAAGTGLVVPHDLQVRAIDAERHLLSVQGPRGHTDVGWAMLPGTNGARDSVVTWTLP